MILFENFPKIRVWETKKCRNFSFFLCNSILGIWFRLWSFTTQNLEFILVKKLHLKLQITGKSKTLTIIKRRQRANKTKREQKAFRKTDQKGKQGDNCARELSLFWFFYDSKFELEKVVNRNCLFCDQYWVQFSILSVSFFLGICNVKLIDFDICFLWSPNIRPHYLSVWNNEGHKVGQRFSVDNYHLYKYIKTY